MAALHAFRQFGWMSILFSCMGRPLSSIVARGALNWAAMMAMSAAVRYWPNCWGRRTRCVAAKPVAKPACPEFTPSDQGSMCRFGIGPFLDNGRAGCKPLSQSSMHDSDIQRPFVFPSLAQRPCCRIGEQHGAMTVTAVASALPVSTEPVPTQSTGRQCLHECGLAASIACCVQMSAQERQQLPATAILGFHLDAVVVPSGSLRWRSRRC
jgi:hypothetical protein